jgi:hypothetical protein
MQQTSTSHLSALESVKRGVGVAKKRKSGKEELKIIHVIKKKKNLDLIF